jgi:hypothetical protein
MYKMNSLLSILLLKLFHTMCTKLSVQNLRNPLFQVKRLRFMKAMHNSDTDSMKDLFILYYIGYIIFIFPLKI